MPLFKFNRSKKSSGLRQKASSMGSVYKNYGDDIAPPPLSPNCHPWDGKSEASVALQGNLIFTMYGISLFTISQILFLTFQILSRGNRSFTARSAIGNSSRRWTRCARKTTC